MKAWLVREKDEFCATVVFAETRGKARSLALATDCCEDARFCDIEVRRMPQADKYHKEGKLEICKKCWGRGFVNGGDENSAWSKSCEDCHGIGYIRVPKTNADRIRAMSDEKLAKFFADFEFIVAKKTLELVGIFQNPEEHDVKALRKKVMEWIQQPAEEE